MELKIHKSVFDGKTLAQLHPRDILILEGYELVGDMSFDGDDYYYFIFQEKINYE